MLCKGGKLNEKDKSLFSNSFICTFIRSANPTCVGKD